MKRTLLMLSVLLCTLSFASVKRENIWPKGKMPDAQEHQIAEFLSLTKEDGFNPDRHRQPFLEWYDAPAGEIRGCVILVPGGGYSVTTDEKKVKIWREKFTGLGFQVVSLVYRSPRPKGLPIWQTAWEDAQRAVKIVRSQAAKRGYPAENIGTISMSAGSHLALLLATSSQTPAYAPVDRLDETPCHINWAIVNAPAYVLTDSDSGTPNIFQGYGPGVKVSDVFRFDEKTCPISLHHGGMDKYSPMASTMVYRELRKRGIPAELHLYPNMGHNAPGLQRGVEFLTQLGFAGELKPEVKLMDRYATDESRGECVRQDVWPEGKTPNFQDDQCIPYIEWHFPKTLKTTAIQILYSGGSYTGNDPDGFEVAPLRRFLNARGMTVVTLKYRTPRPHNLPKHISAWQDLQRTVRLVRSQAASYGLDPDMIGISGCSAGGHLTLMGATSSKHQSYLNVDDIDKLPCNVQWAIGIYPAYVLTDGLEKTNARGGNDDDALLAPEFSFDLDTCPMLFIHGDSDPWASMNSVKVWEKMRSMGIQSELHTLAGRKHCFMREASEGTGSYNYMDHIAEFLDREVLKK